MTLPELEKIAPRCGLSRSEVLENQRRQIFDGMAAALANHGYEDMEVTDVVELAGVSRATFDEHFDCKEACFSAAYEDGVERLASSIEEIAKVEHRWAMRVSDGLRAGLEFLAADPALARLLLVESLAAARPARIEHERSLSRLTEALRPPGDFWGCEAVPDETRRLLAGGLASHVAGRVLAGEAKRLPQDHDLLLGFLLAPAQAADVRVAAG